jgi:hypothetical protein
MKYFLRIHSEYEEWDTIIPLKNGNADEAYQAYRQVAPDHGHYADSASLDGRWPKVSVIGVSESFKVNVKKALKENDAEMEKENEEWEEKRDREEYERLKQKFGGK